MLRSSAIAIAVASIFAVIGGAAFVASLAVMLFAGPATDFMLRRSNDSALFFGSWRLVAVLTAFAATAAVIATHVLEVAYVTGFAIVWLSLVAIGAALALMAELDED
jgi:hypothetical protein